MKTFTVGQVNNYIKNIISQDYVLKKLSVSGEISNCKYHSMGHIYFSLKDETGALPAVMFKGNAAGLDFHLENGQSVIVTGRMDVYERDGRYQLYADSIVRDGTGHLYEEFNRLKYRLNEEGLFDFDKKKPIPKYPSRVGIVTARTGAAIQDIMNIAKRRNPYVELILYPARVQGEGAADTIEKGIRALDKLGVDTIIIGRGGGSMEDLWAFNEEKVVRAVYEANTPIVSGTGHEIDITLADYAADLRAPTPSAACEMAIPDIMETLKSLSVIRTGMDTKMNARLSLYMARLTALSDRLGYLNPSNYVQQKMQYLSELYDGMKLSMYRKYERAGSRLAVLTAKLDGLSPTARLTGGYGYIEEAGRAIGSVRDVGDGAKINITLHDGIIAATVTEVNKT